jgi:hypothetical protein
MRSNKDDDRMAVSAATLADVLVDVPSSLPFDDMLQHVLVQLGLVKDQTLCAKGDL